MASVTWKFCPNYSCWGLPLACVSNKFSPVNTVDIYDSGHFYPSSTVLTQMAAILKSSQSFELRVVNVQQQQCGDDYGLFVIAFAMDLCMGNDPFMSSYTQEAMRDHLAKCFENNLLVQFPQEARDKRRVLSVHEVACNAKKVCSRKRLCKNWYRSRYFIHVYDCTVMNGNWTCEEQINLYMHLHVHTAMCL